MHLWVMALVLQATPPAEATAPLARQPPADAGARELHRSDPMARASAPSAPAPPAQAGPSVPEPSKPSTPGPALPRSGFGWLLLQMILVLLAVCALAYVVLRWGLRRFQRATSSPPAGMRVVERLGLEPRRALYLIEVGRRFFLVGTSEGALVLLGEVDAETAAEVERRRPSGPPRLSFRDVLFRKRG
jgi:flagellar protein FliO/FliZ